MDLPTYLRYRKNRLMTGGGKPKQPTMDNSAHDGGPSPLSHQTPDEFMQGLFSEVKNKALRSQSSEQVRQHACALWKYIQEHAPEDVVLTQSFQSFCESLEKINHTDTQLGDEKSQLRMYLKEDAQAIHYDTERWDSSRVINAVILPSLADLDAQHSYDQLKAFCAYREVKYAVQLTQTQAFSKLNQAFKENIQKLVTHKTDGNKPLLFIGYSLLGIHMVWRHVDGTLWDPYAQEDAGLKTTIAFSDEYMIPKEAEEVHDSLPHLQLGSDHRLTEALVGAYTRVVHDHLMTIKTPSDAAGSPHAPLLIFQGQLCDVDACPADPNRIEMTWSHVVPVQTYNAKVNGDPVPSVLCGIPIDQETKPLICKHHSRYVFYPSICFMVAYIHSECPPIIVEYSLDSGDRIHLDDVYMACLERLRGTFKKDTRFCLWEPALGNMEDVFSRKTKTKDLGLYVKEWSRQIQDNPSYTKAFKEVCKNIGDLLLETKNIPKVEEELEEYEFMTQTSKGNAFFLDRHYKTQVMSSLFANPYFVNYLMFDQHDLKPANDAMEYYKAQHKAIVLK